MISILYHIITKTAIPFVSELKRMREFELYSYASAVQERQISTPPNKKSTLWCSSPIFAFLLLRLL